LLIRFSIHYQEKERGYLDFSGLSVHYSVDNYSRYQVPRTRTCPHSQINARLRKSKVTLLPSFTSDRP